MVLLLVLPFNIAGFSVAPRSISQASVATTLYASSEPPKDWDEGVDYDKVWKKEKDEVVEDMMPDSEWDDTVKSSSNKETDLDLPTEEISELLDAETAAELKAEAREIIKERVQVGMDQLQKMREELKKDISSQKRQMERSSAARAEKESKRLLNKIDGMTENLLKDSQAIRESTKRAAAADAAMVGKGVDMGSWGMLGGAYVVFDGAGDGLLLGSVDNAKKQQDRAAAAGQDEEESATSGPENRILIIADDSGVSPKCCLPLLLLLLLPRTKCTTCFRVLPYYCLPIVHHSLTPSLFLQDPVAKMLIPRLSKILQESGIQVQVVKPTQQIPIGGNNAACVIFFLTSLTNTSPRALLEKRLLRRTMNAADGSVGTPPTQLIAVSTVGTERTDKFPYSMQNLMGRKLEARRDMEESIQNVVQDRIVEPPLDYTILKFGELKDGGEDDFCLMPGDVLDGTTPVDTAANVLWQAIALQPTARNATLCATGTLPEESDTVWEDAFLKLDGPELERYESLGIPADLFVQLTEYLKEWGKLLADSKKLVTPADFEVSTKAASGSVTQRDGLKLLFRPTNTGKNYMSREEEREYEAMGMKRSAPPPRRIKPEGGIEVLVELVEDGLRVRATRTDMGPDVVVKELSEASILKRLKESLDIFVRDYA